MATASIADLIKQADDAGYSTYEPGEGAGRFRVIAGNKGKTQKGDPKFGVHLEVVQGPDQGKKFWYNINLIAVKNNGEANSQGLAISFKELAALGADQSVLLAAESDEAAFTSAVTGTVFDAEVKIKESNGYRNVNLNKIKPVTATPAAPAPSPAPASPAPAGDKPF